MPQVVQGGFRAKVTPRLKEKTKREVGGGGRRWREKSRMPQGYRQYQGGTENMQRFHLTPKSEIAVNNLISKLTFF